MRAAFEEFNDCDIGNKEQFQIVSMDIKALHPSMRWQDIIKAIRELIENSDLIIENIDWHEIGKYLAVMLSNEEICQEGSKPGKRQQRRMIALAVSIGVHKVLGNHTFISLFLYSIRRRTTTIRFTNSESYNPPATV